MVRAIVAVMLIVRDFKNAICGLVVSKRFVNTIPVKSIGNAMSPPPSMATVFFDEGMRIPVNVLFCIVCFARVIMCFEW